MNVKSVCSNFFRHLLSVFVPHCSGGGADFMKIGSWEKNLKPLWWSIFKGEYSCAGLWNRPGLALGVLSCSVIYLKATGSEDSLTWQLVKGKTLLQASGVWFPYFTLACSSCHQLGPTQLHFPMRALTTYTRRHTLPILPLVFVSFSMPNAIEGKRHAK